MHSMFSAQFEHYYHLIPVEPNTPWKYNAHELQHRTTHGVHEEKIQQMLDNLKSQQFLPLYYGWFLTQTDSENLFELGTRCLKEGVEALGENLPEDINAAGNLSLTTLCKQVHGMRPHQILILNKCGSWSIARPLGMQAGQKSTPQVQHILS